jgi:hypothetical protein
MQDKHADNPAWATEEQIVDNLGGEDAIEETYGLWTMVSEQSQKKVLGFNSNDVRMLLNIWNR